MTTLKENEQTTSFEQNSIFLSRNPYSEEYILKFNKKILSNIESNKNFIHFIQKSNGYTDLVIDFRDLEVYF